MAAGLQLNEPYYIVRTKVFKLFGGAFHVYDPQGNVVMYSKQKAFKLREDIRVYNDDAMRVELLTIQARAIIDFSASYDIVDTQAKKKVGMMQRKGFKSSLLRDEWILCDAGDKPIGLIQEDSKLLGAIRRYVEAASAFMPQKYFATVNNQRVCTYKQNFNPFVKKLRVEPVQGAAVDRRLLIAAGVLLAAIEGREN